jgi:hypothetical protein
VPVLRAVVDQEQEVRRWQALDETIEQGLGLAVDPVQVLEDHDQGLDFALAQQQTLDRVECLLSSLRPLMGTGPSGVTWTKPSVSCSVSAVSRMLPGAASCSMRAAKWVVWPTAV